MNNVPKILKYYINALLDIFGIELKIKKKNYPGIGFNPYYLSRICKPKTVIDVGVGHGTHALYNAYPNAHFILIEPLEDYKNSINKIAEKYNCEIFYNALGDEECNKDIFVDTGQLTRSSFLLRTPLSKTGNILKKRDVNISTLDNIYKKFYFCESPIVLKIDTEGHELSVLRGAKSFLKKVEIVIVEVSIAKRFEHSYYFEDLINYMNENDFYLFSILTINNIGTELRPRFADVVFKNRNNLISQDYINNTD